MHLIRQIGLAQWYLRKGLWHQQYLLWCPVLCRGSLCKVTKIYIFLKLRCPLPLSEIAVPPQEQSLRSSKVYSSKKNLDPFLQLCFLNAFLSGDQQWVFPTKLTQSAQSDSCKMWLSRKLKWQCWRVEMTMLEQFTGSWTGLKGMYTFGILELYDSFNSI